LSRAPLGDRALCQPWLYGCARVVARNFNAWKREKEIVFNQLGMLAELMRNAGKLRESFEKAVESLGQIEVEGSAGGGAVTVKVNGRLEVVSVRIDPKLVADADHELLEDLVAAAVNAGMTKAREGAAQSLSSMTGGLPLGLFPDLGGAAAGPGREGP
jgi:DNA-binding YbaB/EbfC family protein